ncbi:MAG: hypothetical protein KAU83_08335, partial [Bacteroidales bacterium]|nr:hypothetical protein [Bacteroidales bacterium]
MNNQNKKGISSLLGIIIVIVIAVVAIGGVLAYQYLWVPEESEPMVILEPISTPTDETADWKTYRNEEYGFEIRYPDDIKLDEKTPTHIRFDVYGDNHLTKEEYEAKGGIYYDQRYIDDIKIEIFSSLIALPGNEKGLSLQEWIDDRKEAYLVGYQKEVQVGEYEGV